MLILPDPCPRPNVDILDVETTLFDVYLDVSITVANVDILIVTSICDL